MGNLEEIKYVFFPFSCNEKKCKNMVYLLLLLTKQYVPKKIQKEQFLSSSPSS